MALRPRTHSQEQGIIPAELPDFSSATCIPTASTQSVHAHYVDRSLLPFPVYDAEGPLRVFLIRRCGQGWISRFQYLQQR